MRKSALILTSILALACSYIGEEPYTNLDAAAIGSNPNTYLLPANEAYTYMQNGFNFVGGSCLDAATDDAMSTVANATVHRLARGYINMDNTIVSPWANSFRGIRQACFAQHVLRDYTVKLPGRTPGETAALKAQYYYEMTALRAHYEFTLLQYYGGFPIVDEAIAFDDRQTADIARNSFSECVEHICELCDTAAAHLYVVAHNDNAALGRMTRGAALAIKAKTLLYAASPLYNRAGNTNPLIGYTAADVPPAYPAVSDRWRRAAHACMAVLTLQKDDGTPAYSLVNCPTPESWNTSNFLTGDGSVSEWIFIKTAAKSTTLEKRHYPPTISRGSGGGTVPTQELVNAFCAADGSRIAPPTDGQPTITEGREPRFYAFIAYDGCRTFDIYNGATLVSRRNVFTHSGKGETKDAIGAASDLSTTTGYYMAKFLYPQLNFTAKNVPSQYHLWPIIRLADIYLMYAEAMVCGYDSFDTDPDGLGMTALDAVKAVRARAGFGAGDHFYDGITTAADFMEQVVKCERRIELCFEGSRYFDLRRWMDAPTVLNRPVHGVQINYDGTTSEYNYFEADSDRSFSERMYFHPIAKSVLKTNPNIIQNPGY